MVIFFYLLRALVLGLSVVFSPSSFLSFLSAFRSLNPSETAFVIISTIIEMTPANRVFQGFIGPCRRECDVYETLRIAVFAGFFAIFSKGRSLN